MGDKKGEREKKKGGTKREAERESICVLVCLNRDWRFARGVLHQYRSFSGQDTWDGLEKMQRNLVP